MAVVSIASLLKLNVWTCESRGWVHISAPENHILWFKNQNLGDKFAFDQVRMQTRADRAAETPRPCINPDSCALYWMIGGWKASLCREDGTGAGGRPVWTSCQSLSSCRLRSCTFLLQVHGEIDDCLCGCWNMKVLEVCFFFFILTFVGQTADLGKHPLI